MYARHSTSTTLKIKPWTICTKKCLFLSCYICYLQLLQYLPSDLFFEGGGGLINPVDVNADPLHTTIRNMRIGKDWNMSLLRYLILSNKWVMNMELPLNMTNKFHISKIPCIIITFELLKLDWNCIVSTVNMLNRYHNICALIQLLSMANIPIKQCCLH